MPCSFDLRLRKARRPLAPLWRCLLRFGSQCLQARAQVSQSRLRKTVVQCVRSEAEPLACGSLTAAHGDTSVSTTRAVRRLRATPLRVRSSSWIYVTRGSSSLKHPLMLYRDDLFPEIESGRATRGASGGAAPTRRWLLSPLVASALRFTMIIMVQGAVLAALPQKQTRLDLHFREAVPINPLVSMKTTASIRKNNELLPTEGLYRGTFSRSKGCRPKTYYCIR